MFSSLDIALSLNTPLGHILIWKLGLSGPVYIDQKLMFSCILAFHLHEIYLLTWISKPPKTIISDNSGQSGV